MMQRYPLKQNGLQMNKPKVYISKSNLVDYDHLIKVRSELAKLDLEIIEYDGKTPYDNNIVNKADYMLVLTYNGAKDKNTYFIGKGVYSEINTFLNKKNIFIIDVYHKFLILNKINKVIEYNTTDYKRTYAKIYTEFENYYISNIFPVKEVKETTKNTNKYLLLTS